jgi:hypothetical protein
MSIIDWDLWQMIKKKRMATSNQRDFLVLLQDILNIGIEQDDKLTLFGKTVRTSPDAGFPIWSLSSWDTVVEETLARLKSPEFTPKTLHAIGHDPMTHVVISLGRFMEFWTHDLTLYERQKWWSSGQGKSIHYAYKMDEEDLDRVSCPRKRVSLRWVKSTRSCEALHQLPQEISVNSLLLRIIAEMSNCVPGEVIGHIGQVYIQEQDIMKARDFLRQEVQPLPSLRINTEFWPTQSGECGVGPLSQDPQSIAQNANLGDFTLIYPL